MRCLGWEEAEGLGPGVSAGKVLRPSQPEALEPVGRGNSSWRRRQADARPTARSSLAWGPSTAQDGKEEAQKTPEGLSLTLSTCAAVLKLVASCIWRLSLG